MLADDDIFKAITFRCQKCGGEEISVVDIDRHGNGDFLITMHCHGESMSSIFSDKIVSTMIASQPRMKFDVVAFDGYDKGMTLGELPKESDVASIIWHNRDTIQS